MIETSKLLVAGADRLLRQPPDSRAGAASSPSGLSPKVARGDKATPPPAPPPPPLIGDHPLPIGRRGAAERGGAKLNLIISSSLAARPNKKPRPGPGPEIFSSAELRNSRPHFANDQSEPRAKVRRNKQIEFQFHHFSGHASRRCRRPREQQSRPASSGQQSRHRISPNQSK